jgi:hypothetical protein
MGTNVFKRFHYPTKVNTFLADDKYTEPELIILLYFNPSIARPKEVQKGLN